MTDSETKQDTEEFQPKGTVLIAALFVVMLVLLWGSVYVILLARGATS